MAGGRTTRIGWTEASEELETLGALLLAAKMARAAEDLHQQDGRIALADAAAGRARRLETECEGIRAWR